MARPKKAVPIERTSAGLRDALFDELDALRSGNSTPGRSNAIAKLAMSVVNSVRADIEAAKFLHSVAPEEGIGKTRRTLIRDSIATLT